MNEDNNATKQQTTPQEEKALAETTIKTDANSPALNDDEEAVIPGETLSAFATRLHQSITVIKELNPLHVAEDGLTILRDRLKVR